MLYCIFFLLAICHALAHELLGYHQLLPYKSILLVSPRRASHDDKGTYQIWKFSAENGDRLRIQFDCRNIKFVDSWDSNCLSGYLKVNNKVFCDADSISEEFSSSSFQVELKISSKIRIYGNNFICRILSVPTFDLENSETNSLKRNYSIFANSEAWHHSLNLDLDNLNQVNDGNTIKHNYARIVGGKLYNIQDYPYQGFLSQWGGIVFCGASLISKSYALTAAHCVKELDKDSLSITFGSNNVYENDITTVTRDIKKVIAYKMYSKRRKNNDIALLKLSKPVSISEAVNPVCLPKNNASEFIDLKYLSVSGYGGTSYRGNPSESLKAATIIGVPRDKCKKIFPNFFDNSMICAYGKKKDPCQGDSGGPLTSKENGKFVLRGIISIGYQCATQYPGIYCNVANYVKWISSIEPNICIV